MVALNVEFEQGNAYDITTSGGYIYLYTSSVNSMLLIGYFCQLENDHQNR